MKNILTIAAKEFKSYFVSPMAYAVMAFILLISGFIFVFMTTTQGPPPEASLRQFTGTVIFLLILMSSPVREYEVVLGKYLASLGFLAVVILSTLEFPVFITAITHSTSKQWPEMWPMVVSYVGWIVSGAAFLSVGVLASTLTRSQLAAAILALLMLLVFWLIGWLAGMQTGVYADVLKQLHISEHVSQFEQGVLGLKDVVYFLSMIVFFLFASTRTIESTRWR